MSPLTSTSAGPGARAHALVMGGSIGGMCVAEVLSRHFARVTIVERDLLSDSPDELRRGVPQGAHPHGVLTRGRRELESLFPGLTATLLAHGAFAFDGSYDMARYMPDGWAPRYHDVGAHAFACSRPLLESTIRQNLKSRRNNVSFVEGTRVTELLGERRGEQLWIEGVRTDAADPRLRELRADLVVDCTGRGTKSWKWLREFGLELPEERRVDAKINYATRHYQAPPEASQWWWKCLLVDNAPPHFTRAGAILNVEKGRWLVTAQGVNGDYAPTDEAGWLAFLQSLRSPVLYEVLQRAKPLSDIIQSRTTVNVWKQMHRWNEPLNGLLLFGDTICTFNPAYGQGLTSSALAAGLLDVVLARDPSPPDRRFLRSFYRAQAKYLDEGWAYSTTLDLRWPGTVGERPFYHAALCQLSYALERVAIHDPHMLRKLIPLVDFDVRRYAIFTPEFVARGAYGLLRRAISPPRLPGPREIDPYAPSEPSRGPAPFPEGSLTAPDAA